MARLSTTSKVAAAAGLASLAVLAGLGLLTGGGSAASIRTFFTDSDTYMVAVAVVASAVAAVSARMARGRMRAAWVSLVVGLLGFAVGSAIWLGYVLTRRVPPYPSVADAAYLLLPIAVGTTLVLLATGLSRSSRTRLILDGLMVAASFTIVVWAGFLDEVWQATAQDELKIAVSMTYPVLDAAVLTIAILILARAQPGQRLTLALLAIAVACIAVADGYFVYLAATNRQESNDWVDLGWLAGLLLLMAAAVAGRRYPYREVLVPQPSSAASVWLPFVPVAAAFSVGLLESPEDVRTVPIMAPSVVLVVAFLIRQLLLVTENRRLLDAAAAEALRDPLTGVANRIAFRDQVADALDSHRRGEVPMGVLVMDLDDFKLVNDTLGHPVGDELLGRVAERIRRAAPAGDVVARLGGDEFAVLVRGADDQSQAVANAVLAAFERPFLVENQDLLIRPSVGLVVVAGADDAELTAEDLLKRADMAMYSAKRSRTGSVHMFNAAMLSAAVDSSPFGRPVPAAGGVEAIRLLGELRQALERRELVLVYQPKFDLRTSAIVGVEALIRWPHPGRGLLMPDLFLPLVRRYGLMGRVNEFVVNRALADALQWRAASVHLPVAVNIFAPSMADIELPAMIAAALDDWQMEPADLTVEITEDLFLDNMQAAKTGLEHLRGLGIQISIDDFGSGYSALAYMRELAVDEVKLDRQFIAPILTDARADIVVRAVLNLADELGFVTVAEGIENAETADWLREHGCHVGQGYYFSRPLPPADLLAFVARHRESRTEIGSSHPR